MGVWPSTRELLCPWRGPWPQGWALLVLGIAISAATWGCRRIAAYLAQTWQVRVAPSTVQRLLRRVGLATRRARLTVLEQQAARTAGLLTDRTRQTLWRARHGRTRHVEANEPGQLVCLDTFYIGNLKGVGKVWQITACDAATSYGLAGLLPAHDAAAAATFLREVVVPHFQRAGWPVRRVLTDGGPEFKGAFDVACRELGLRHTRTKPRHAWTNGFVERLQGTILQELWRASIFSICASGACWCATRKRSVGSIACWRSALARAPSSRSCGAVVDGPAARRAAGPSSDFL